jgi:outer membrane protein assembly factor BamB
VQESQGHYAGLLRTDIQAFSTQLGTQSWASELFHNTNGARVNVVSSTDTPNHIYFSYLYRLDGYYPGNGTLGTSDGSQIWHVPGRGYSRASLRHAPELAAGGLIYQSEGLDLDGYGRFGNSVIDSQDGTVTHSDSRFCLDFQSSGCFCDYPKEELCPPIPTYVNAGYGLVVQAGSLVDGWQPEDRHAPLIVSRSDIGTVLWTLAPPVGLTWGVSALTPDTLYIGSNASTEARLYAFRARTGEVLWSRVITGNATIQPTVANGVVYLGNRAYDARNGDLLWTNPGLVDTVSPIVVNGRLYANQIDGNVSAWGLD